MFQFIAFLIQIFYVANFETHYDERYSSPSPASISCPSAFGLASVLQRVQKAHHHTSSGYQTDFVDTPFSRPCVFAPHRSSQWLQSRKILGDAVGAGAFASTVISVAPIVGAGGQSGIKPLCINLVALAKALGVEPLDGPTTRRISGKTNGMDGMEIGRHNLHIDQRHPGAATAKVAKEKV